MHRSPHQKQQTCFGSNNFLFCSQDSVEQLVFCSIWSGKFSRLYLVDCVCRCRFVFRCRCGPPPRRAAFVQELSPLLKRTACMHAASGKVRTPPCLHRCVATCPARGALGGVVSRGLKPSYHFTPNVYKSSSLVPARQEPRQEHNLSHADAYSSNAQSQASAFRPGWRDVYEAPMSILLLRINYENVLSHTG